MKPALHNVKLNLYINKNLSLNYKGSQ